MIKIDFSKQASKSLESIYRSDSKAYYRIMTAIESLAQRPYQGKKLKWKLKGDYSIRVGIYRVVYTFNKTKLIIHIIDVGHRREIYQK